MGRTARTTCDWPDDGGCGRSPANGDVLYRTNPKREIPGIFMCEEHAARERAAEARFT